ncbi:MAG: M61 family metallopeptidase [Terriglobia bacterium]
MALVLLVTAACPFAAEEPSRTALDLQYELRLRRPTSHLLEIEISASGVNESALDFVMPAWAPGRYAIYDFAKNVQEFSASDSSGKSLPWTKTDKQTWRVDARQAGGIVHVRYRVFANDLSGSFSQFDSSHACLNGPSLFMYVDGHKPDPLTLHVEAPSTWQLVSGFSASTDERRFKIANYDVLVDTPMEISAECLLAQFEERGKMIRVAVHSYGERDRDISPLVDDLKKIVRAEMAMMPEADLSSFTFIFHFVPGLPLGDGMEHLNSTQVIVRNGLSGGGLAEALETGAHEFFHLWNVKRLRPAGLGPFDYTREQYTRSLWFAEGITSYYSYLFLLRAGVWTREQFLERLAGEIRAFEFEPGRRLMSAESSSFHAWFYDRSPQMQETNFANTTVSYYNQGAVLGLLLDLEIRGHSGGRKSLDDVLVSMYRKFYSPPASNYYGPGRGYGDNDILEAVNAAAGADLTSFFDRYIRGTDPFPYTAAFASVGLRLRISTTPGAAPSLGVLTNRVDRGLQIVAVRPGSAADLGGLSRDDILLAVDELPLAVDDLPDRLRMYPPGAVVPFQIERHGRERRIEVKLDPPLADQYSIEELHTADIQQIRLRKAWLESAE